MGKKRKRAAVLQEEEEPVPLPSLAPPLVRDSDEPVKKKVRARRRKGEAYNAEGDGTTWLGDGVLFIFYF